jgi:hypothetical protein
MLFVFLRIDEIHPACPTVHVIGEVVLMYARYASTTWFEVGSTSGHVLYAAVLAFPRRVLIRPEHLRSLKERTANVVTLLLQGIACDGHLDTIVVASRL